MIALTIVGIISAIVSPAYQNYTVRSAAVAALAEISPVKVAFEQVISEKLFPCARASWL